MRPGISDKLLIIIGNILLRRFWIAASFVLSLVATVPAGAADLPSTAVAPVMPSLPPPAFSWTGFYIGVNAGGGIDHFAFSDAFNLPGGFELGRSGITSSGPVIGGQVGYNYQLDNVPFIGHAVVGVEADSDWASLTGWVTTNTKFSGPAVFGTRFENFGSLRARVGYNFDHLLLYLTGGPSFGTTENYFSVAGVSGSQTTTRFGDPLHGFTAAGVGAEYALDNHFSVRAEYLYDCILAHWVNFETPNGQVGFNSRSMYHIVRLGLNYKFDLFEPAPVVAKY